MVLNILRKFTSMNKFDFYIIKTKFLLRENTYQAGLSFRTDFTIFQRKHSGEWMIQNNVPKTIENMKKIVHLKFSWYTF